MSKHIALPTGEKYQETLTRYLVHSVSERENSPTKVGRGAEPTTSYQWLTEIAATLVKTTGKYIYL
jgi:hypothetical protein